MRIEEIRLAGVGRDKDLLVLGGRRIGTGRRLGPLRRRAGGTALRARLVRVIGTAGCRDSGRRAERERRNKEPSLGNLHSLVPLLLFLRSPAARSLGRCGEPNE